MNNIIHLIEVSHDIVNGFKDYSFYSLSLYAVGNKLKMYLDMKLLMQRCVYYRHKFTIIIKMLRLGWRTRSIPHCVCRDIDLELEIIL